MPFELAVVVAYLIGMVVAYLLARGFVFQPSGQSTRSEFLRFGLVNLVGIIQVWLVSIILANWLLPAVGFDWNIELVAHTIGVLSPVITSYFGHKLFTFRRASDGNR